MDNEEYQQSFLKILLEIPQFSEKSNRNTLLFGIPGNNSVDRRDQPKPDLQNILQYVISLNTISVLDKFYENLEFYASKDTVKGKTVKEKFDSFRDSLFPKIDVEITKPPANIIPFTNREDELSKIIRSDWPNHYIDAPAGYGKTEFLLELRRQYLADGYLAAYADANSQFTSVFDLTQKLIENLRAPLLPNLTSLKNSPKNLGFEIGKLLINLVENSNNSRDEPYKGIAILIDNVGGNVKGVLPDLLNTFFPAVYDILIGREFFKAPYETIRFIIAGRYLGKLIYNINPKIGLRRMELHPFDVDVVTLTSHKVFPKLNWERRRQISAHAFFLTGGHPSCLGKVLRMYSEASISPETFVEEEANNIWAQIKDFEVQEIWESVKGLEKAFRILRFYRFFDDEIIKKRIQPENLVKLVDSLTETYMVERTSRYYSDAIARRLMMLDAVHEMSIVDFQKECDDSYFLYLDRLKDQTLPDRTKWAAEGIFQYIQSYTQLISDPIKRKELRTLFYSKDVIDSLLFAFAGKYDIEKKKRELGALVETIEKDWELIFLINYFFRGEAYTTIPWGELKEYILSWGKEN